MSGSNSDEDQVNPHRVTRRSRANVTALKSPVALSLVKVPASQATFRVVRGDRTAAPATETRIQRSARHVKRSAILFIELSDGATEDDIAELAAKFGIEDYVLEETQDGCRRLRRADSQEPEDGVESYRIGVSDTATVVVRRDLPVAQTAKDGVQLVSVSFDKAKYADASAVTEYLRVHRDLVGVNAAIDETESGFMVHRVARKDSDKEPVQRIDLEDGVSFYVRRAEVSDPQPGTPAGDVIACTSYGRWGWGQLSFVTALADKQYCRSVEEAIGILEDVLDELLMHSSLPMDTRKSLATNALNEFSQYISAIIGALPPEVVVVSRKDYTMSVADKQTPGEVGDAPDTQATTDAAASADTPIQRSDVPPDDVQAPAATITEADVRRWIADAFAAQQTPTPATAPTVDQPKTAAAEVDIATVVRDAISGAMTAALAPISERVAAMESVVVVRADRDTSQGGAKPESAKSSPIPGAVSSGLAGFRL